MIPQARSNLPSSLMDASIPAIKAELAPVPSVLAVFEEATLQGDPPREGILQVQKQGLVFCSDSGDIAIPWKHMAGPRAVAKEGNANPFLKLSLLDHTKAWSFEMKDPSRILQAKRIISKHTHNTSKNGRDSVKVKRHDPSSSREEDPEIVVLPPQDPDLVLSPIPAADTPLAIFHLREDDNRSTFFSTSHVLPTSNRSDVTSATTQSSLGDSSKTQDEGSGRPPTPLVVTSPEPARSIDFVEGRDGSIYVAFIEPGSLLDGQGMEPGMRVDSINRVRTKGLGLDAVGAIIRRSSRLDLIATMTDEPVRVEAEVCEDTEWGWELAQRSDGAIVVSKIAPNGILASTELNVGMVLKSVNDISLHGMDPDDVHKLLANVMEGKVNVLAVRPDPNRPLIPHCNLEVPFKAGTRSDQQRILDLESRLEEERGRNEILEDQIKYLLEQARETRIDRESQLKKGSEAMARKREREWEERRARRKKAEDRSMCCLLDCVPDLLELLSCCAWREAC